MANWKPIASAPKDRNFLVDGGTIEGDLSAAHAMDSPVKVEPQDKYTREGQFYAADTEGYAVWVNNPLFWCELPKRHPSLSQEFDL